jgi:hypothetical protein
MLDIKHKKKTKKSFLLSLVFSSTKLEKRAEQVLPGSKGGRGKGGSRGKVREVAQTMYAHMNT